MKVLKFGSASINSDGSITVTVTLGPENTIEAAFLGFVAATVGDIGGATADPMAAILEEAAALKIPIPT